MALGFEGAYTIADPGTILQLNRSEIYHGFLLSIRDSLIR